MTIPTIVPARLHVLLARKATTGVIIRRGPSRQVCTLGWDRKKDIFTVGQWFKGRIYERRSDLSPDGKLLIYFAMNGKRHGEAKGSWTAISKTPYLKATALWGKGDCWNGGGLFIDSRRFWLNEGHGPHHELLAPKGVRSIKDHPLAENYGGECPGVYYLRLQRDGWRLTATRKDGKDSATSVFEKQIGLGWVLRKFAHATIDHPVGKGCYFDTHELVNLSSGKQLEKGNWQWADLDRKRLVWAEDGSLFAGHITRDSITETNLLHDFNGMTFESLKAPY